MKHLVPIALLLAASTAHAESSAALTLDAIGCTATAGDVWTTHQIIQDGGHEQNPLIGRRPGLPLLIGVGVLRCGVIAVVGHIDGTEHHWLQRAAVGLSVAPFASNLAVMKHGSGWAQAGSAALGLGLVFTVPLK